MNQNLMYYQNQTSKYVFQIGITPRVSIYVSELGDLSANWQYFALIAPLRLDMILSKLP